MTLPVVNRISENTFLGEHFAGIHLMAQVTGNIVEKNQIKATFESVEVHARKGNLINTDI
ncbi:MAG: hypothetical protein H0A75_04995 [Candidatus Methanofishera endochildressiae]|uniref:Uncharacterized protein n=1 Tax=Candidatus Methanofishera endochildressiae TaxID=2738884 RepID=A0A7Z0SDR8_9GAMM|nr:hypothetical protein [Candidatus Methanofishera endochildressiae]